MRPRQDQQAHWAVAQGLTPYRLSLPFELIRTQYKGPQTGVGLLHVIGWETLMPCSSDRCMTFGYPKGEMKSSMDTN